MQNGNQASAHLENKETNSATENGIMSPPTGERGVVPGPAAGVSQPPPVEVVREMMDILLNGRVVGAVEVTQNATTYMVESVLGWELTAALCQLAEKDAKSGFNNTIAANPSLRQVIGFFKIMF